MTATTEATELPVSTGCSTHEGLVQALRLIEFSGWDSDAGRAVLAALQQRSGSWATLVDRRCGLPVGTTDPGDVVTTAWITLSRFSENVRRANAPWAYLWISVGNTLAVDNADHAYLSRSSSVRDQSASPLRAGLGDQRFAAAMDDALNPGRGGGAADVRSSWSPALLAMLSLLVDAGGDETFWAEAIDRAVEVLANSRRSYEVVDLRHDPYMLQVLGLTPPELSALAALLIGPCRADRGAGSLFYALHREPSTVLDGVPGAPARVRLLLARTHSCRCVDSAAA